MKFAKIVFTGAGIWGFAMLTPLYFAAASPQAQRRPIDTAQSTLTVFVYKSGLFSAFGDDHIVRAPVASGWIAEGPSPGVELSIRAADLKVTDPQLAAEKRAEVQEKMLSADVLDAAKFPEIAFTSTSVQANSADRWTVAGRLTLHGQTREMTVAVSRAGGVYRGEARIKQRDFGIEPVRVAGGTVRVKDEVKVAFEIAAGDATR
jgi:hypothetical protein